MYLFIAPTAPTIEFKSSPLQRQSAAVSFRIVFVTSQIYEIFVLWDNMSALIVFCGR